MKDVFWVLSALSVDKRRRGHHRNEERQVMLSHHARLVCKIRLQTMNFGASKENFTHLTYSVYCNSKAIRELWRPYYSLSFHINFRSHYLIILLCPFISSKSPKKSLSFISRKTPQKRQQKMSKIEKRWKLQRYK